MSCLLIKINFFYFINHFFFKEYTYSKLPYMEVKKLPYMEESSIFRKMFPYIEKTSIYRRKIF